MSASLKKLMLEKIVSGIQRKSVSTCSRWSEKYRVMGEPFVGPWSFDHHPWLLEMHDCTAPEIVGQKAAQLGYTEWALNKTFFTMDVLNLSVLYILPSSDDAGDFSSGRFDKALENSVYLNNFFSDVKNVGHKRAGNASLYVRGSRSRSKLKSIDTALIIFDELDEMMQENLALATTRQDGQRDDTKQILRISTATIEDKGINFFFKQSTQQHYMFKCPSCSRLTELIFPECLIITAETAVDQNIKNTHYICKECKNKLPHETKLEWLKPLQRGGCARFVPSHSDRDIEGFYVNQMYSFTVPPYKLASLYLEGKHDATKATEFFNSKMGQPYAAPGSKVTETEIIHCTRSHRKGKIQTNNPITMGIDVGGVNHVVIEEWFIEGERTPALDVNDEAVCKVLYEGTTSGSAHDFQELENMFRDYGVDFAVIDAEPERRIAYQFATRWWGKVYLCDFLYSQQGRSILVGPEEECTVKVNRTSWLDLALGRFKSNRIHLPSDCSHDYKKHIREPQRVYKLDRYGNPYGYYESVNADHFAFARLYSELALVFAAKGGVTSNLY